MAAYQPSKLGVPVQIRYGAPIVKEVTMLYLIERKDKDRIGCDEFDAFVVSAGCAYEALFLCGMEAGTSAEYFVEENVTVTELGEKTKRGVILGSFNAG